MNIINYPHPTLRHASKPLKKVDKTIRIWVEEMFELMYASKGIGLAANQVDLPFQLFVVNTGEKDTYKDLVFINPVIKSPKGQAKAEEGCLSLPGLYGQVARPEKVQVTGFDLQGNPIDLVADGLLARVIQHEFDHLQGTLFIDRMDPADVRGFSDQLYEFELELQKRQQAHIVPSTDEIHSRLAILEKQYC